MYCVIRSPEEDNFQFWNGLHWDSLCQAKVFENTKQATQEAEMHLDRWDIITLPEMPTGAALDALKEQLNEARGHIDYLEQKMADMAVENNRRNLRAMVGDIVSVHLGDSRLIGELQGKGGDTWSVEEGDSSAEAFLAAEFLTRNVQPEGADLHSSTIFLD